MRAGSDFQSNPTTEPTSEHAAETGWASVGIASQPGAARRLANALRGKQPTFVCVLAHTDTCLVPGISAAGVSPELRPLTPAADAEVILRGAAHCLSGVPSSPLGPPGPAIITRAALQLSGFRCLIVDAGTRVRPQTPSIVVGTEPGRLIGSGRAVPHASELFLRGLALGRQLARKSEYLVVGESVPAGTTTALALLSGLGYRAYGRVSSSMGENAHALKTALVREALAASALVAGEAAAGMGRAASASSDSPTHPSTVSDALAITATVGDPMQPVVAGLTLGALERIPVLLAGGTQMVAVLALMHAIEAERGRAMATDWLGVATTRWVVDDPTSDFVGLLDEVAAVPALFTKLSFAASRQEPLRYYENFLVKEGVGAGGAAVAAWLSSGVSAPDLARQAEEVFLALSEQTRNGVG